MNPENGVKNFPPEKEYRPTGYTDIVWDYNKTKVKFLQVFFFFLRWEKIFFSPYYVKNTDTHVSITCILNCIVFPLWTTKRDEINTWQLTERKWKRKRGGLILSKRRRTGKSELQQKDDHKGWRTPLLDYHNTPSSELHCSLSTAP